jgi:prefoldin alpha subunit
MVIGIMAEKKKQNLGKINPKQQEIQEKILLYQILHNHVEQLRQQAMILEKDFIEIDGTIQAVEALSAGKTDHETFVPLGSGCYGYGKISNSKKFLVNVGAGIVVDKTFKDAKEFLENRKKEREKMLNRIKNELDGTMAKITNTAREINELQHG